MVALPAERPFTIPVVAPTGAVPEALLAHVPPEVASVSVVLSPRHTPSEPAIAAGVGLTVTGAVT